MSSSLTLSVQTSSDTDVPTGGAGAGAGSGSPTGAAGAPANGPGQSSGNGTDGDSTPATPVLVGGIVGGVAGLAFLLLFLLFLLRWRKRQRRSAQALAGRDSQSAGAPPGNGSRGLGSMTTIESQNRPLSLVGFLRHIRPTSQQTASTETAPSERGFYRVSGRKIAPVLGGPAVGGPGDGYRGTTLSETSFYFDDGAPQAGPSAIRPMSPTSPTNRGGGVGMGGGDGAAAAVGRPGSAAGIGTAIGSGVGAVTAAGVCTVTGTGAEDEVAVMRPGPARTPLTAQGPYGRLQTPPVAAPRRPLGGMDGIGRSHASQDGSRGSRFTEDVG